MFHTEQPIAVVGMACLYPQAPDLETYWQNILKGHDAITEISPQRWDQLFYDPEMRSRYRVYCKRGGFVDDLCKFDPSKYGIMPVAAQGAESEQLLALEVATQALADARLDKARLSRLKAGVIIGRGNYPSAIVIRLVNSFYATDQTLLALRKYAPHLDEKTLSSIETELQAQTQSYGADTAIGLVPNLSASRIANRLNLNGSAYTVDAACASSLLAIDHACRELQSGRLDAVLAGGVHLSQDVVFTGVFCQLGALSHQQQIRPFDKRADGLLTGEGVGMVVCGKG